MSEKKFSSRQNEELLRELALRLATFPGDPRVMNPQLFVGELPQHLPVEIPLPENSHVLGSGTTVFGDAVGVRSGTAAITCPMRVSASRSVV